MLFLLKGEEFQGLAGGELWEGGLLFAIGSVVGVLVIEGQEAGECGDGAGGSEEVGLG